MPTPSSFANMSFKIIALAALAAAPAFAAPIVPINPNPICFPIGIPLQATSNNFVWAHPPNPNNEAEIIAFFKQSLSVTGVEVNGTTSVTQSVVIKGRYCQPLNSVRQQPDLILLAAGLTYNHRFWGGLGIPTYDYQLFAGRRGYATFAFDRLGTGDSEPKPEPINIVQTPLQVEMLHALVGKVRLINSIIALVRPVGKVLYAGHSFGAIVGAALSIKYPNDIDAYVLEGLSDKIYPPVVTDLTFNSARNVYPRFSNLPLGYLAITLEADRTSAFYGGDYDPNVAKKDYDNGDTGAVGEFATISRALSGPSSYTGPVFMTSGELDTVVCNPIFGDCGTILAQSKNTLFPSVPANKFGTYAVPNSAHSINLHRTAPATFDIVTDWLDSVV